MTDPRLPNAHGFAGNVGVLTSWGLCRLHDLARLSKRRDAARDAHAQLLAEQVQVHEQALTQFDQAVEQLAAVLPSNLRDAAQTANADTRAALQTTHAVRVVELDASGKAEIDRILPLVNYDAGPSDRVALESVAAEPELVVDVVDVVIAQHSYETGRVVDGQPQRDVLDVKIRCTPDCMFVTSEGDVAAADLLGKTITRVHADGKADTFVVPSVTPVTLDNPITVYRVTCLADACCVGVDSSVTAVVRC